MANRSVVVDSSVMVKWLSQEGERHLEKADTLMKDMQQGKIELYSSELAKYEVGNALLQKGLPLVQVKASHASLYALPIRFISETQELSELTAQIAHKSNMTYYDAAFVSLAQLLGGVLVTDNIKHQGKATTVTVIPLAKYS